MPMHGEGFEQLLIGIGITLDEGMLHAFEQFEEDLYRSNAVMNLTRVPREECYLRHFLDSLLFHDLIPAGASVLDIGTGPGFPAWPLALCRKDLHVLALDSSGKMLGFLRRHPLPNLEVVQERAEEWG
ncbi:MAG TPA: RsmG family class I SAM-dependent methyltransferase, partial [Fimbriimonadaceae bacterium]|nr:RsmG family class I SAM-dependent methyltransferase [Fimbriimonadaceae bacterium]